MTARSCVTVAAFLAVTAALPAAQRPSTPTTGNASIAGVVIDGVTRKPVSGVRVSASAENYIPNLPTVLTDAAGAFTIGELPAGRYSVSASKGGYLYSAYGQVTPAVSDAVRLTLDDNTRATGTTIMIWREGAISGRVLGESGSPVIGVTVYAVQRIDSTYTITTSSSGTNDRGEYRISRLVPGEYKVLASCSAESRVLAATAGPSYARWASIGRGEFGMREPADAAAYLTDPAGRTILMPRCPLLANAPANQMRAYVSTAAGAPRLRDALAISLAAGEEREHVDVHLDIAPATQVSGTITNPDGPIDGAIIELMPEHWDGPGHTARLSANAARDGTFSFLLVPAGRYTLTAWRRQPPLSDISITPRGMPMYPMDDVIGRDQNNPWVRMPLSVGETPISDLALTFRRGPRVSGRVVHDNDGPAGVVGASRNILFDRLDGLNDFSSGAVVTPDGTFNTHLFPGRYLIEGPRGANPRSRFAGAIVGGRNIGNGPIEVGSEDISDIVLTSTSNLASLSGIVTGSTPPIDVTVMAFPVESEFWIARSGLRGNRLPWRLYKVRSRDGQFAVTDVLPGEYFVAAVPTASVAPTITGTFLEALSQHAQRVHLGESESRTLDLSMRSR